MAEALVAFYKLWHGRCRLPGAGYLLRRFSNTLPSLHRYPLEVDGVGTVIVDFRDHSGFLWLQHLIGDELAAYDIGRGLFIALRRLLKEDLVFWDIGANAGTVSAYVATAFPGTRIFAFEPNPGIFNSLAALFSNVPRVTVYPLALSDKDATVVLTIPPV